MVQGEYVIVSRVFAAKYVSAKAQIGVLKLKKNTNLCLVGFSQALSSCGGYSMWNINSL